MHALAGELDLECQPAGHPLADGPPESYAVRGSDLLEGALKTDLEAWLAWLQAACDAQADEQAMRRMGLVYGAGWAAVSAAVLAIPLAGVAAAVLSVVLLAGMLALGCVVTQPIWRDACSGLADDRWPEWSRWDPAERARLVRIINLSRVAARPPGARLLLSELDEALTVESLMRWPPLSELRDIVRAGCAGLVPFGSEPSPRESPYLFVGHVP